MACKHLGDWPRAIELLQEALLRAPAFVEAQMHLADLQLEMGLADEARAGYTKVLRFRPEHPGALGSLAVLAEAEGDRQAARAFIAKTLRVRPRHAAANLTAAAIDLDEGHYQRVREKLTLLLDTPGLTGVNRAIAHTRRGFASEKLESYDAAFDDFRQANELLHRHPAPRWSAVGTVFSPAVLDRILADLNTALPKEPPAAGGEPPPTFLLGFPRSGTTLLEQIIAAHPGIATVEESDTLQDVYSLLTTAE